MLWENKKRKEIILDNKDLIAAVKNIKKTFKAKRELSKPSAYKERLEQLCRTKNVKVAAG